MSPKQTKPVKPKKKKVFSLEFFQKAGKKGGALGGPISRTKMTKERATEIAMAAAAARTKNPQKLKAQDIPKIFKLLADGVPHANIAERFGVKTFTIWAVEYRRTWKHIQIDPAIIEAIAAKRRQHFEKSAKSKKHA